MAVTPEKTALRPFTIEIPEADLDDLRRRIAATRWPSKELVADRSQGVQLATLQELALRKELPAAPQSADRWLNQEASCLANTKPRAVVPECSDYRRGPRRRSAR